MRQLRKVGTGVIGRKADEKPGTPGTMGVAAMEEQKGENVFDRTFVSESVKENGQGGEGKRRRAQIIGT